MVKSIFNVVLGAAVLLAAAAQERQEIEKGPALQATINTIRRPAELGLYHHHNLDGRHHGGMPHRRGHHGDSLHHGWDVQGGVSASGTVVPDSRRLDSVRLRQAVLGANPQASVQGVDFPYMGHRRMMTNPSRTRGRGHYMSILEGPDPLLGQGPETVDTSDLRFPGSENGVEWGHRGHHGRRGHRGRHHQNHQRPRNRPYHGQHNGPHHGPHNGPHHDPLNGPHHGPQNGLYQGPHDGPHYGPHNGSQNGLHHGPYNGSHHGPHNGPHHGPHNGPYHGPHNGPHGPHNGPHHGLHNGPHGPYNGPHHGPHNWSQNGPHHGPHHGPRNRPHRGSHDNSHHYKGRRWEERINGLDNM